MVLDCVNKQAEPAMESKPVSVCSVCGFCLSSCLQAPGLTHPDDVLQSVSQVNPLLPSFILVMVFITAVGVLTKPLCEDYTADMASLSEKTGEAACFFSISAPCPSRERKVMLSAGRQS